jgi:hypothetical protein
MRIRDPEWRQFGSGINIPDPQHCLNGFKKIVWAPGMVRDQKNHQKVPKDSQYGRFRGKNVKI